MLFKLYKLSPFSAPQSLETDCRRHHSQEAGHLLADSGTLHEEENYWNVADISRNI